MLFRKARGIPALMVYPIARGITARLERLGVSGSVPAISAPCRGRGSRRGEAALATSFNDSPHVSEQLVRASQMLLASCSR
jgi:hypothetical protein